MAGDISSLLITPNTLYDTIQTPPAELDSISLYTYLLVGGHVYLGAMRNGTILEKTSHGWKPAGALCPSETEHGRRNITNFVAL